MNNVYQVVTDQIIAELRAGCRPWVQQWSLTPGINVPCNAITGRAYSGINTLLLFTTRAKKWPQPRFLTFRQAQAAGGHVRKGEHGQRVVFVKDLEFADADAEDETRRVRMLRQFTVFNLAQCEELPEAIMVAPRGPNRDQRDALIDTFIAATGARFIEERLSNQPAYVFDRDAIVVPDFGSFHGCPEFYAAAFHELIHWTGHTTRLDRQLGERFGAAAYAAEELIAELGAAFLCAEFNVDSFVPHAAYLQHYLRLLEDDPKAIFTAASKAQAAVNFLHEKILAEPTEAAA
jgi:antirestriction protein ArdC